MSYLGSWKIDDLLTFTVNTQVFATGVATDADSAPAYRVYEDETTTPILTGTMALLDSSNTAGFYSEQITLSAANGFEKGKSYSIYISATVSSVAGATHRTFQIGAEVDVRHAAGVAWASGAITAAVIATGAIDADAIADNAIDAGAIASDAITAAKIASDAITSAKIADNAITANKIASDAITAAKIANNAIDAATFAADVDAEILSYLVDDATRIDASALNTAAVTTIPTNLDATVGSRATQTSVDDLPTNAELATALGTADDATLAAIAGLNNLSAAQVNAEVDTALADYDGPTNAEMVARTLAAASYATAASLATTDGKVDSILADTGTDGVVVAAASKDGYRLSSTGVDDVLDELIGDSTITMRQALKLAVATLGGKLSGAATTTVTIRNAADDANVVVATVDADGNRSAVTLSL